MAMGTRKDCCQGAHPGVNELVCTKCELVQQGFRLHQALSPRVACVHCPSRFCNASSALHAWQLRAFVMQLGFSRCADTLAVNGMR